MVDAAQLAGADHTMFVAGNDAEAKAAVTRLLKEGFGWKDIVDLGDVTMARGLEMWLPLWVRLWGALGTPMFNLKVVR
jgi:predicted dinucleotide-binding enzyme